MRCWLPQCPYDGAVGAFSSSTSVLSANDRTQTSESRSCTWFRVRCARARACARERGSLCASRPSVPPGRIIHYVSNYHPFPAPGAPPRDNSRPNTGIYWKYGTYTYPVYTGIYLEDEFPVPGIYAAVIGSPLATVLYNIRSRPNR